MAIALADLLFYKSFADNAGLVAGLGGKPTFARSSTGSSENHRERIWQAPAGKPRFVRRTLDGEPTTGMLLEAGRTNSLLHSEDFTNAAWVDPYANMTVGSNLVVAPDGTMTGDKLSDEVTNNFTARYQGVGGFTNNEWASTSVFIKKDDVESRFPEIGLDFTGGTQLSARFHLNTKTGAIAKRSGYAAGSGWVEDFGDWWRVLISLQNDATGNTNGRLWIHPAAATTLGGSAVAEAVGSIYVWGAQLEKGVPSPSSYIGPTTTAAVTRAADSLIYSGAPGPQAMAIYCRGKFPSDAYEVDKGIVTIGYGSNPRAILYKHATAIRAYMHNGTSYVLSDTATAPVGSESEEYLMILNADGSVQVIQSIDGGAVTTSTASAALALPSAWYSGDIAIGKYADTAEHSGIYFDVKVVKLAALPSDNQGRMDEMRHLRYHPTFGVMRAA